MTDEMMTAIEFLYIVLIKGVGWKVYDLCLILRILYGKFLNTYFSFLKIN